MFSWPAQDNDFLAKLLACCRGEPSTEEIDSDDFVAQRFSDGRKELARANHDSKIRCLIADDIRQFRIGSQNSPQICQVTSHSAEVKLRHLCI